MAEFITDDDGTQVAAAVVYDDPDVPPPDDPVLAPKGWTWNRSARQWKARRRVIAGQVITGQPSQQQQQEPHQQDTAATAGNDPDPGWMQDGKPAGRKRRQSIEDVPKETVDDMAGLAGLVGAPVLAMLQQADPYCGSILAQNYEPIVDAVLPLLCRSEKITSYFAGDKSDWLLWGKLAMALAPVGRAILEHHVIRSVEVVRDPATGTVQIVRGQKTPDHGDHLVPPGPPPSFQYAA